MKFNNYMQKVIEPDGVMVQAGVRYQHEQVAYMKAVADFLTKAKKDIDVGAIEASTGIGKSLGYLIPTCIWLACQPKSEPILVTTHTRALQNQIMKKDILLAKKVLGILGLSMPVFAYRMGKQAFFSISRVATLVGERCEGLDANDPTFIELKQFQKAVGESCHTGTGLWQDYIEEFDVFPQGIQSDDICLNEIGIIDNPAYETHLIAAKNARLLISNHATLLNPYVFKDSHFALVVADESHEIKAVCESLSNHRLLFRRLNSDLVATGLMGKVINDTIAKIKDIEAQLNKIDAKIQQVLTDTSHHKILADITPKLAEINTGCAKVLKTYLESVDKDGINQNEAKRIERLEEATIALENFVVNEVSYRRRAIMFSKVNRYPSVASISNNAGSLFAYRIKTITNKVILTSATIADINQKNATFVQLSHDLGLYDVPFSMTISLTPAHYGEMDFVVAKPTTPRPLLNYGETSEFNEVWLTNTATMIEAACDKGISLVLTQSFDETRILGKRLKHRKDILVHTPANTLGEIIHQFLSGDYKALISPSAWHGVSIRDKATGGQYFNQLVITRVPYKPADADSQQVAIDYMLSKGKSIQTAKTILHTRAQQQAVSKLTQGIGRGCRAPTDKVTVWFCDPRMSMVNKHERTGLIHAIPKRFLDNYNQATVFGMTEDEVVAKAEKPTAIYL